MRFSDNIERDPEDCGYVVLYKKEIDVILSKKKDDPNYKKSFELVRATLNQTPAVFIYKLKLKDLDIEEGFHSEDINYVSKRIE